MSDWLDTLRGLGDTPAVLVTVARVRGSAPRAAGTRLIVTAERVFETIGGGNLEFRAIELARELLRDPPCAPRLEAYPLGAALGQCCGGHVTLQFEILVPARSEWLDWINDTPGVLVTSADGSKLWITADTVRGDTNLPGTAATVDSARRQLTDGETLLIEQNDGHLLLEPIRPPDFHIALFGAGHVGRALVQVLSGLPCRIHWIDGREQEFPAQLPGNVERILSDEPDLEVDDLPNDSYLLVMTHSHALDEAICERALKRGRYRYLGLIGSQSKLARFRKRWRLHGVSESAIATLTCPIGIPGISGKHPSEIAIAVAAQLLQRREDSEHVAYHRASSMSQTASKKLERKCS